MQLQLQIKLRKLILRNNYILLEKFLQNNKIDLNYIHGNFPTNLAIALTFNSKECLNLLFKNGMDTNIPLRYDNPEIDGMTALMIEARVGNLDNVKILLKNNASVYFKMYNGKNISDVACKKSLKCIKKYICRKKNKIRKSLYNSVAIIDNFIIDNIVDFLYPKF